MVYDRYVTVITYILQDHIAWTDQDTRTITWAHRADGSIEKQVSSLYNLGAMITWDIYGQPPAQTSNTNKVRNSL